MTWFYLTGFIFLLGGEINVLLESNSAVLDLERPIVIQGL